MKKEKHIEYIRKKRQVEEKSGGNTT